VFYRGRYHIDVFAYGRSLLCRCFVLRTSFIHGVSEVFASRLFIYVVGIWLPSVSVAESSPLAQSGIASVYSLSSGSKTANGERLNPNALTAAHRTMPFGTKVRVLHAQSGRSVVVTINDRGPFVRGRIIDLTPAAARVLGFSRLAHVTLKATK
jgi:rare lipoprotein A